MAELFVPKIIDELGDVVVKQLGEKINLVMGVEEEVANIKRKLETIQNVLQDAERRRLKEEPVGKWLEELEDITYAMDDVLDEWNIKIQKPKNEGTQQNARLKATLWSKINSIISVVGAGGSGKTTLAQLLFNDDRVKNHFELKKWVCVSDPFDEKRIARAILESPEKSSLGSLELEPLLQLLKETFSGKRFLFVLDDVWTEDDSKWKPFKDSLKDGAPGSVILVTTRSHRVATVVGTTHTHQMTQMSDSDCWLIMQRLAFANKSGDLCKKVERIGQKISERCKGLPLAAKTMGSLLRFKDTVQQWQNVLDSEIWQLEEAAMELFPHLYLSYNELSPELKRCFSYCAVFPKDTVINVMELIWLWIAQGYVRPRRRGERLELVGREYFNNLAMRSFFQELKKVGDEYQKCKMHDIVHDFAQFLTKNECHVLVVPQNLFRSLKCVRTLTLSDCELAEIPAEIGRLIHLRHLDLSDNRFVTLPEAICDLYYLETFYINDCEKLSCLPERIEGLVHLRHLHNDNIDELRQIPQGLGKVTSLCCLTRFIARSNSDDLAILKDLNQLECCIGTMEPPPNLERLRLVGYPGAQLPSWLVTKSLINNLIELIIDGPHNISSLPALGKLSSLEQLTLQKVEKMECLGKEFFGVTKALHESNLSEDDEEVAVSIMPCLEELKISQCTKLETLPHRILGRISSLKKLNIWGCYKLRDRYSDKTGDDWKQISHIPQVYISDY
ncbi:unnamed protein product [Coffea canephora]|uniref:DH200=94 genomic scaffold, scaffold_1612 n=1 Tax=Coffea canephora TaxID=49390 RepID=A0A068VJE4_COFCA|nr:unnamed protein product [Coffea canephora]